MVSAFGLRLGVVWGCGSQKTTKRRFGVGGSGRWSCIPDSSGTTSRREEHHLVLRPCTSQGSWWHNISSCGLSGSSDWEGGI